MKRAVQWVALVLLVALTGAGCKQKFQVIGKYQDTPVVYGLLNFQSFPNYVRIEKGYLLQGNAYVAAGNPDSIYYPNCLIVDLIPVPSNGVDTIKLTRVNGSTINMPKDSGLFAGTPNWLYVTPNQYLDSTITYQLLVVDTSVEGPVKDTATSQTPLVYNLRIYSPYEGQVVTLSNTSPFQLSCSNPGSIYDITIRVFYYELNNTTDAVVGVDSVDLPVWRSIIPSNPGSSAPPVPALQPIPITQTSVLNLLANNLTVNTNIKRKFRKMAFLVSSGAQDLASFLTSQQAESGLASSNTLPPYTNVKNGVGLLSSRVYAEVDSVVLDQNGLDSLACSTQSGGLRFENSSGNICY